jgi:hypothetical protein
VTREPRTNAFRQDLLRRCPRLPAICIAAAFLGQAFWSAAAVAAPCNAPRAVRFARGQTAAEIHGGIARGELDCRTFSARGGQHLSASVGSAEHNVVFQIYRPGWRTASNDGGFDVTGTPLPGAGEGDDASSWSGRLPRTGSYLVVLGTTRGGGEYRLRLRILRR